MAFAFFIAALLCMAGVVFTLFAGLIAMGKGAASNKMMQARVLLQGLAILFLLLAYLAK